MKKKLLIFSLILVCANFAASAHKFYTSLTQIEYNASNGNAEVIINLYTDDLEAAVSGYVKRNVKAADKDFERLVYAYLDTRFQLKNVKNQPLKNEYIGTEQKRDMLSIFLEIRNPLGLNLSSLMHIVLLETFNEQTNIVNVKSGKIRTSLVFKSGAPNVQTVNLGSK